MITVDEMMQQLRRKGFLARLEQLTRGDTAQCVDAGSVGFQLGLPLETTLEVVDGLHADGLIHRCGELEPSQGPEVHLTALGAVRAREAARWASGSPAAAAGGRRWASRRGPGVGSATE